MIDDGTFTPGDRLPSERELSERFATNRGNVKEAISRLVRVGLVDQKPNCRPTVRVLSADKPAYGLSFGGKVAVWMQPDLQDFGTALILQGVRQVVGQEERQLLVSCPQSGDREEIYQSAKAFFEGASNDPTVEGLIVWPSDDARLIQMYQKVAAHGLPLIFVDRDPPTSIEADVVAVDHFRSGREATRHLIGLGHRRIAMIGNDDRVSSVGDRRAGYLAALGEAGIPIDERMIVETAFMRADEFYESVRSTVEGLLALNEPPTAMFAVNDQIAMYVHDVLQRLRVRVPEDVSLVGFDWILRRHPRGGELTTVAQPFEEIGRTAARRLFDRLRSAEPLPHCHLLLTAPVVVLTTTGKPRPLGAIDATYVHRKPL